MVCALCRALDFAVDHQVDASLALVVAAADEKVDEVLLYREGGRSESACRVVGILNRQVSPEVCVH